MRRWLAAAVAAGAVGAAACRPASEVCGGQPTSDCGAVAGTWEGTAASEPDLLQRFRISIAAVGCAVKGSFELSPEVPAPLDGAMCEPNRAELAFDGAVAAGEGELGFDLDTRVVAGALTLTVKQAGTDVPHGTRGFWLTGQLRLEPCDERCDDGNPCTDDLCEGAEGCQWRNNSNACDDGDPCTVGDFCSQGSCTSVTRKNCDDEDACTADSCEPTTGVCRNEPIAASAPGSCDDGDPCTGPDSCQAGVCVGPDTGECACGNDRCDPGETCNTCAADCDGFVGIEQLTFCCGDGVLQLPEEVPAPGERCDGNF